MPTNQTEPNPLAGCPVCSGPLWDNRDTKKNPKAPDYKCKDKSCEGVIWPPKNGAPRPAAPAASVKAAHSAGPYIEALDGPRQETGAPPVDADPLARLTKQFNLYDTCLDHAHSAAIRRFGNDVTDTAVAAMAATLYIQANQRGLGV